MPAGNASPVLIVALGASNTAGWGVGEAQAWPAIVERLLRERGLDARVVNAGISGNTTGEMLARLDAAVPAGTRVVVLQPGSNDARLGIPAAERERNIQAITASLTARGCSVVRVAAAFAAVQPVNVQADGIHLTAAGHAGVARFILEDVVAAAFGLAAARRGV